MNSTWRGITGKRLLVAMAILVIAPALLIPLGVEPIPFFLGLAAGMLLVSGVAALATWRRRPASDQPDRQTGA